MSMFLRSLTSSQAVEAELDEEMRFHIDMQADAHARSGLSQDEARRRARLAFGGVEQHKEAMREGRGARGIERAAFDVRFALRQLRKTPGFTIAAVLTLALGIGGNTAVFSVVNGVLLRPLEYPDADRIVSISHRTRGGELPTRLPNSSATHVVYQEGSRSFDAMALYSTWQGSLVGDNAPPDWVDVVTATRSLFDVLRVPPSLGRTFTPEEDTPGGPHVAIISDALWRQRFGADPSVVGRTITLDGTSRQVVGVLPAGFAFPTPAAVKHLHAMVAVVRNEDFPRRAQCDTARGRQLTVTSTLRAKRADEATLLIEHLDAVVIAVRDKHFSRSTDSNSDRTVQLAFCLAL
jgi:hypothetical protein